MPGFDRTGPMGQGSQTGRRTGKCSSNNETTSEITNDKPRRRFLSLRNNNQTQGQGQGLGRGARRQRGFGRGANQS